MPITSVLSLSSSHTGSNVKPVEEEAAESATSFTPKSQTEAHPVSAGGGNDIISPPDNAPPARQSVTADEPAAPPKTLPAEPAAAAQAPPERPVSLQGSPRPEEPVLPLHTTASPPLPEAEVDHQLCPSSSGISSDSNETSVLSPFSLSDSDLIEAALDSAPSLTPEQLTSERQTDVTAQDCPLPHTDITQSSESKTSDRIHLTTVKESSGEEQESITVTTCSRDEAASPEHSDPKSNLSVGSRVCDVPDGLESEDQLPLPGAGKNQQGFFKRGKKKNKGNLCINLNKLPVWSACVKGKSMCVFLMHFTVYIILQMCV